MTTQQTPFNYVFTRKVNETHWTITIECDGKQTSIRFERGPSPFWHTFENGTCLEQGTGAWSVGYSISRIQALRYVACGLANMHGGGIGTDGNRPGNHRRIWSPKKLRQDILRMSKQGPWIEFDCVNFDSRTQAA